MEVIMPEKDLKSLQNGIKQKGYEWQAEDTTLSTLSTQEQKARCGLVVDKLELEATENAIKNHERFQMFQPPIAAPVKIDWRNRDGDWTTPVKDQSSCGSCVSFGVVATIEARINIICKRANLNKNLSEAHLFYCGCGNCCGTGWNFAPALDFCKNTGVGLEASFPYTPGNQPCKSGVTSYLKITNWTSVLTVADRKNVIATKGPVVGGMAVYSDFFSYKSGVYRHVTGGLSGYHAISVVGYDDDLKCWICKNSWGTGWGDNGWFKIGYGECMMDTSFAFYDVDLQCPEPVDICVKYKQLALKYWAYFKQTGNRRYLCTYYRYVALYYACLYRLTKSTKYLCLYYRYMAQYYYCIYGVTKNLQYLTYYKRYLALYQKCR